MAASQPTRKPRVVVVGAGIGGLRAADEMLNPGSTNLDVVVLEASDRVGGRTASMVTGARPDVIIDIGGQWIGEKQDVAKALVNELGITLSPQYCTGRRVLQLGALIRTYSGLIPNIAIGQVIDVGLALFLVQILQFFIWCLSPRSCVHRWADRTTVEQLSNSVMWSIGGKALLRIVVQALFGAEPSAISVLAFCRYSNSNDSLEHMSEIGPGSLQAYTCIGGAQQICLRLAQRMLQKGGSLHFNAKVVAVAKGEPSAGQSHAGNECGYPVRITCEDGRVFECDAVLMAMPPPIAQTIIYTPQLSPARTRLMAESNMGCIIKSIVIYDRAWWREDGFSGEVICDTSSDPEGGPAFNIFDGCTPVRDAQFVEATLGRAFPGTPAQPTSHYMDPNAASRNIIFVEKVMPSGETRRFVPALVAFINGASASRWTRETPENRRAAVLKQFAKWYSNPAALHPVEYIENDWVANPFTKGCPIASYGQGVLDSFGLGRLIAQPEWEEQSDGAVLHRMHFAGTESAEIGTGFMDGAIRSGIRAAVGIRQDLARARMFSSYNIPEGDATLTFQTSAASSLKNELGAPLLS